MAASLAWSPSAVCAPLHGVRLSGQSGWTGLRSHIWDRGGNGMAETGWRKRGHGNTGRRIRAAGKEQLKRALQGGENVAAETERLSGARERGAGPRRSGFRHVGLSGLLAVTCRSA